MNLNQTNRTASKICSQMNKLVGFKISDRDHLVKTCSHPLGKKAMEFVEEVLQKQSLTLDEHSKLQEIEESVIEDLLGEDFNKLPAMRLEKQTLEEDIFRLEEELKLNKIRESTLQKQYDMLSAESSEIKDNAIKTSIRVQDDAAQYYQDASTKVLAVKFNESLKSLHGAIQHYLGLLNTTDDILMSRITFDEYLASEREYTKALGDYCEKIFFPGISAVPGNDNDCHFLDINGEKPVENKDGSIDDCFISKANNTVRLIKSTFRKKQINRLMSVQNLSGNQAKVQALEELIEGVKDFPQDEFALNQKAKDLSIQCVRKESELKAKWELEGEGLLERLQDLQGICILIGDYTLKLKRQDYFTSRQDLTIKHLISQLSRQEFLMIILEQELKSYKRSYDLLSEFGLQLRTLQKVMKEQEELVEGNNAIIPKKSDRLCISNHDSSLNCALEMLTDFLSENHGMFRTFEDLGAALKTAVEGRRTSEEIKRVSEQRISKLVQQVNEDLKRCSTCLENGFTSTTYEQDLLASSIKELESKARTIKDAYLEKCELFANNPELNRQRNVFVDFFKVATLVKGMDIE